MGRASALGRSTLVLALALMASACGYTPLRGGAGAERLHVALAESKIPAAVASDEVLAGVREELARAGTLAPGDGFPRCEVEILRADEASEGIAATPDGSGRLAPQSRATRVGLVARAWVVRTKGGERERDTGDVRAFETVSAAADARASSFRHDDALRAAGRRVGQRLAARVLGLPSGADE
jgi:hypothetical protein